MPWRRSPAIFNSWKRKRGRSLRPPHGGSEREIPVVLPRTHGAGLLVLSPGVGRGHAASLDRGARALAGVGVRRLLLREPSLDAEEVRRLARGLLRVFPRDGLLLHEKCAGARAVAASLGVGLHLSGAADWAAERARFGGRLGVSAHSAAEVARAAELGMQWAFLSPVFQPASKPGDTRPHLGERAVVAAQAAHPGLTLHALGGVTPEAAVRLTRDGVGGVCVLGGVWTVRPDGSAEADVRAAERYVDAMRGAAARLRGGARSRGGHSIFLADSCESRLFVGGGADVSAGAPEVVS